MSIWNAYLTHAWFIALIHAVLLLICLLSLAADFVNLLKESKAYKGMKDAGFGSVPVTASKTELARLHNLAYTSAARGELIGPDTIRRRLSQALSQFEGPVRYCLNAFIISGLLGTLFNLWKLGPEFWEGLVRGGAQAGQPAIGIAFAASVFGLGLALFLSFVEHNLIRFWRDRLTKDAAADVFEAAAGALPPTEGAAVAEALKNFYSASEGFLSKLKNDHEELSRQFITQIRESSTQLTRTLQSVSGDFSSVVGNATRSIETLGGNLGTEVNGLTAATADARTALVAALPRLTEAERLGATLAELRGEAASIQERLASRLAEFNEEWRKSLLAVTDRHAGRMEEVYTAGWGGYEEAAQRWHRQNVEALNRFATDIESSLSRWDEARRDVAGQVNTLIEAWRGELGRSTTGISAGLADLHEQISGLKQISVQLANLSETAFSQLRELQNALAGFSTDVIANTPLGTAINDLAASVRETRKPGEDGLDGVVLAQAIDGLNEAVRSFGRASGNGGGRGDGAAPDNLEPLLRQIVRELHELQAKVPPPGFFARLFRGRGDA